MRTALALLLLLLLPLSAGAQTHWHGRSTDASVGIHVLRPEFTQENSEYGGFLYAVSASLPINASTTLILELPFVSASYTAALYVSDEGAIANPYLGLEFGSSRSEFFGELGVRVPFMQEQKTLASYVGALTDINSYESYIPRLLQISAAARYAGTLDPNLLLLAHLGPSAVFVTEGGSKSDLYASYGAVLQLQVEAFFLGAGYAAKSLLTSSGISDRTVDHVLAAGSYRMRRLEVGVEIRFPLDQYVKRNISRVYGMTLRVTL